MHCKMVNCFREVKKMEELPHYYTVLFQAVEQALDALDEKNYGLAKQLLIHGQQDAEEAFLAAEES